ncbi:TetR/AcrR family transcriptional regulator [Streptomyces sp. NBC_01477]|uniref:TetR/AcrR family transcriptional regulator n=1 Tax=Streptomyces sp. NBC_01477 TaxID=2976015 RepID=UPI002E35D87B|nr:helix-turn-helix domain-containing protein [Streptomyces sp. NBC_01477]
MTAAPPGAGRADARRNRTKVLLAAVRAFGEQGLEVSLGEIARQAGVGTGTVYRHFPSKEILLEAVLVQHVDDLVAAARRWSGQAAPTAALFGFLRDVIDRSARRSYVCDAVTGDTSWPRPLLAASAQRFHQALAGLLRAAQQSGGVRADVGPDDVTALTIGCVAMRARGRAGGARMVHLTLEGLRGPAAVTEGRTFRHLPGGRHATAPRCEECEAELASRATGRPARYCGATCRQRAHRRRLGR